MRFILFLLISFLAMPVYALDTCNSSGNFGLCTLPCGTVTSAPTQVLGINPRRTELLVVNTGSNTIYVILGKGNSGYDFTYGIPLAGTGSAASILDLQVQPDPSKALHTWTSAVSVATSTGTGSCVFAEQAQ